jgi:hypothetical protein
MIENKVVDGVDRDTLKLKFKTLKPTFKTSQSRNSPELDPSILRHTEIRGAAEEAVLNHFISFIRRITGVTRKKVSFLIGP